jgi:hypothetical protein
MQAPTREGTADAQLAERVLTPPRSGVAGLTSLA